LRTAGFKKVLAFVSYHGQVLTPLLPIAPFAILERGLQTLPSALRRRLAHVLTAVK